MDLVSPIIDIVKFVGGPIWGYLKKQKEFSSKLKRFNDTKKNLLQLQESIQSRLDIELQTGRKIARNDVETWLKKADEEISRKSVEDEVSGRGCLSCICRTRTLEKRTEELLQIYQQGETYKEIPLVVDDHSRILDDNMKTFQELKEKLRGKLQDVKQTLDSQLHFGKVEKEQVKFWRKQVEELIGSAAKDVEDQVRNGHPSQHASLAHLIEQQTRKMESLLYSEGGQLVESLVVDDPLTSALELPTSELQGGDAVKAEVLACLMEDEVMKLGVWGMGGVGKTTIMEHVYNQLLKEAKFKEVIWITVSQTFDIHQIQQKIASSLKAGEELSKHQESVVRAAMLSRLLETCKPYELILDDVWSSFELKDVGIPEPLADDCCKLVLTTRSKEVAREMGCDLIEVKTLPPKASLELFLDVIGDVASLGNGGIIETMELIVAECGGLPLAIKTVAGSMKRICDLRLWNNALKQLRQGKRNDAFSKLKFSYDWLVDKKVQYCFLHCAMYPEDYIISEEALIEYWIDEELIDVMGTREEMKEEGYAILKKLEENCLLESTGDSLPKRDCVRMHDLVRDMALHIIRLSNLSYMVKAGIGLQELPEMDEWSEDLIKVSLKSNGIRKIPRGMCSPKCLMLTTLLLSGNNFSMIPKHLFDHMPELKVLDLSENRYLKSLPRSISKLVKLTTLLLRSCGSLKKVPSLYNLRVLKKLDLHGSRVEEVPHGLEMLVNLKYLDMNSNERWSAGSEMLLAEILPNLSKLQYLWLNYGVSVKEEVLGSLSKLETFIGRFPTATDASIFLKSRRASLHQYMVIAGGHGDDLRYLDLVNHICYNGIEISGEPNLIPSNVQRLWIDSCNDVRSLNDVSGFQDAVDLRVCKIENCKSIKYVCSWPSRLTEVLEQLTIKGSENLNSLFEVEVAVGNISARPLRIFSSLEKLYIHRCPKIKKLLPVTVNLPNLIELKVSRCEQLEEIVCVSSSEERGAPWTSCRVMFPKLQRLILFNLPMLRSICSPAALLDLDSLKELKIRSCPNLYMECLFNAEFNPLQTLETLELIRLQNLKSVFDVDLALWAPTTSFPLHSVIVQCCPQLKNILPNATLFSYIENVVSFEVESCDQMEEIVASSGLEEQQNSELIFPKLQVLTLTELPLFRGISGSVASLVYDSLYSLRIADCLNLCWECIFSLPMEIPQTLRYLRLKGVRNLECLFDEEAIGNLGTLIVEDFHNPPSRECISGSRVEQPSTLRILLQDSVFDEENTESIWTFSHATPTFPLEEIVVENCPQLKKIISHAGQIGYFPNLRKFKVTGCDELEEVISSTSEEESLQFTYLPGLLNLELSNLPKLKRVVCDGSKLICGSLWHLSISGCKELKRLPFFLQQSDDGHLCPPPSLKVIKVSTKEKEWWESLEWDYPDAESVLTPFCKFLDEDKNWQEKETPILEEPEEIDPENACVIQ